MYTAILLADRCHGTTVETLLQAYLGTLSSDGLCQHLRGVLSAEHGILVFTVVDGIDVAIPAHGFCPELPDRVRRDLRAVHHRQLPRPLNRRVVQRRAVLLQDDRLARGRADGVVLEDPLVRPGVVVAPGVRIDVEYAASGSAMLPTGAMQMGEREYCRRQGGGPS